MEFLEGFLVTAIYWVSDYKLPTKYYISGDIENLKRAFINILDNAIRYSPTKEGIQIEIFKRASSVVIRVRDKGIGLEENEFNDIFSRFYRGDPSRTKFKKSGSGLGLSLIHIWRCRRHG